jgi:hypothetical protein
LSKASDGIFHVGSAKDGISPWRSRAWKNLQGAANLPGKNSTYESRLDVVEGGRATMCHEMDEMRKYYVSQTWRVPASEAEKILQEG